MKSELIIFGITAFLIGDTYYDGKYTQYLTSGKKYFKMMTFGFVGFVLFFWCQRLNRTSFDAGKPPKNYLLHVALNMPPPKKRKSAFLMFFMVLGVLGYRGSSRAPGGSQKIKKIKNKSKKQIENISNKFNFFFGGSIFEKNPHFLSIWCLVRAKFMKIGTLIMIFSTLILYFICFGLKTFFFYFFKILFVLVFF